MSYPSFSNSLSVGSNPIRRSTSITIPRARAAMACVSVTAAVFFSCRPAILSNSPLGTTSIPPSTTGGPAEICRPRASSSSRCCNLACNWSARFAASRELSRVLECVPPSHGASSPRHGGPSRRSPFVSRSLTAASVLSMADILASRISLQVLRHHVRRPHTPAA